MIAEMENYKSEVKHTLNSHGHNYTLLLYYPISFLEKCYFSCLMPFLASNINNEKYFAFE